LALKGLNELYPKLTDKTISDCNVFENIFSNLLNKNASVKTRLVCAKTKNMLLKISGKSWFDLN